MFQTDTMIKKRFDQVNRLIKDALAFEKIKQNKPEDTSKAVLVSIKHHTIYHRFFICFLNFTNFQDTMFITRWILLRSEISVIKKSISA